MNRHRSLHHSYKCFSSRCIHIIPFDPQAALRGVVDKAEISSQTLATRKNGGRGAIFVVLSSPLERTEMEAMRSGISPFSGAPKGRNVGVGPGLILFTLPENITIRGPWTCRTPSPTAPQPEIEIEELWARRGHWRGSNSSSRPSENRMGPSVNRIRLVNS